MFFDISISVSVICVSLGRFFSITRRKAFGEIGVIKKDVVFSGDVVNTTSRIQSLCNEYNVNLLLSKYLLDKLHLPPSDFYPKRMGMIELKGKRQKVELYTFEESEKNQLFHPILELG